MYAEYFGFSDSPFNSPPDPRYFYASPEHEEALASLINAVQQRKGILAVTGAVGVGTTLPGPMPLRRMVGPSVIMAGLSIGSGEFVLWPRLTAVWGFGLFWACRAGVTIQFFLNMYVERWTLAPR